MPRRRSCATTRASSCSSTASSTSASGCCSATATTTRRTRSRPTGARSIESVQPLLSHHFNLTVELPLKAIIARLHATRSCRSPGRTARPASPSSRCTRWAAATCSSCSTSFLEHHLSRGDYRRAGRARDRAPGAAPRSRSDGRPRAAPAAGAPAARRAGDAVRCARAPAAARRARLVVSLGARSSGGSLQQPAPSFPTRARGLRAGSALALLISARRARAARLALAPDPALAAASTHQRARRATALTAVGYMGNNVLPARGGEVLRDRLLGRALGRAQARDPRLDPRRARARRVVPRGAVRRPDLRRPGRLAGRPRGRAARRRRSCGAGAALARYWLLRRRGRFERSRPASGRSRAARGSSRTRRASRWRSLSVACLAARGHDLLLIAPLARPDLPSATRSRRRARLARSPPSPPPRATRARSTPA